MFLKTLSRNLLFRLRPKLSRVPVRHHNFEGENPAKAMTVTMLSKEDDDLTYIEAYSVSGFRLKSGFSIVGPCAIFPRSVLHWNVSGPEDISAESLSLFTILEPKIDILILGLGDAGVEYDKSIIKYLRNHKINVEILPTDRACSTFNFLNAERRYVAGALIPPTQMHIDYDEDSIIRSQINRRNIYELETDYNESLDGPGEFDDAVKNLKTFTKELKGKDDDDSVKKPKK